MCVYLNLLLEECSPKPPKYISNENLNAFFKRYAPEMDLTDFISIRNFFEKELKCSRRILSEWNEFFRQPPGIKRFEENLKLKRYSPRTIKSYLSAIKTIHGWLQKNHNIAVDDVDELHARKYFLHLIEEKNSSASLTRVHRFALELFLFGVHGRVVDLSFARGIKRETRVPSVLNKKEIEALLSNVNNHKHRAMIALIYSAGLRISEVLKLRVRDVDCDSLTLHLRQAKGKKDRITVFSEKLLPDLKIFLKGKEPNDYVFPSQAVGKNGKPKPLSARALQAVFQRCLVRAGIQKRVTPHDLRHTFATHLLENGIGIRHIQSLLGHRHISTTAIYTKVANPKISGIKSPY